jgi:hypothetical protein
VVLSSSEQESNLGVKIKMGMDMVRRELSS